MLGRLADWITIITALLTILSTFAAWSGRLDELGARRGEDSLTVTALTVLMIIVVWSFLFLAQLRAFVVMARRLPSTAAFGASCLMGLLALAIFCSVELLILEALMPRASGFPLIVLGWMVVPVILWVVASWFAILFMASVEFE